MKNGTKAIIALPFDIVMLGFITMMIYNLTIHKVFTQLPEISIWHGMLLNIALKFARYKYRQEAPEINFTHYFISMAIIGGMLIGFAYLVNFFI